MKVMAVLFFVAAIPTWAHHSYAAEFDDKKPVTLKGAVTGLEWNDPHVYFSVDVKDNSGNVVTWALEMASPVELKQSGWTRAMLKVGDVVTVEGNLARDGSKLASASTVILASGKKMPGGVSDALVAPPRTAQTNQPTPRWPDGHPRLSAAGPEPGYWAYPNQPSLIETTAANVRMNRAGLLANPADAAKVAPFQPWARGLYEYRQRTLLKDDPMASCLPPGGPRQFQIANGVQFLEDPDRQRLFVMSGGGNRNWRLIYLDGRPLPSADDLTLTYYGNSIGHWEGDTLVVTATGFNERFWFSNGGLPHTESLRLTEKFSRPDFNTLQYEVTVNDPGAYTRPWTSRSTLQWVANQDIGLYFCEDNNKDVEHLVGR
jgi:hypothetical protein